MVIASWPREASFSLSSSLGYRSSSSDSVRLTVRSFSRSAPPHTPTPPHAPFTPLRSCPSSTPLHSVPSRRGEVTEERRNRAPKGLRKEPK